MLVDPNTLDTTNPLALIGGTNAPRNMTTSIPLEYKDGRVSSPMKVGGGYDPRLPTDGLVALPRVAKVVFDELYTTAYPNYHSVRDKYVAACGDGKLVGLIFRTPDNFQRIRFGRLLTLPDDTDGNTPLYAHIEMTFAVEMFSHDLYPAGTIFYDTASAIYDTMHYDPAVQTLPIVGSSQTMTFTINGTAEITDIQVQILGPMAGPFTLTLYWGPNNIYSTSVAISDTLIVNSNGYIDYYQIDSGTETVTKDGVEIFDQNKVYFPPGQNDWLKIGKVDATLAPITVTMALTCPGTGLGASSAVYLSVTSHYL